MVAFGDSILSGAAPAVYERFPGIVVDAEPIRQWRDAPAVVQQALDAGTLRAVVVLSFGTNAGLESAESQQALRTVLDRIGPARRVVLVNTVGVSEWVPSSNAALAEISAGYPNTLVMDWHSTVAADPGLLHSDRTHANFDGIQVYAEQVARTLEQLGPE
jgi:lysophospholipase L1-like esterase